MNILVTGGCGFIGSNFIHFILDNTKENVIVLDKLTYAGNSQNIWRDFERNIILEGDINNYTLLDATHETRGIDLIVHFAAESHVDNSINSPDEFIQTNIVGTHTLLKFALEHNIRFIHISTDEVYGSLGKDDPPSKEGDVYKPNSPYSASKAASDHLVRAYHKTYGLPVNIIHGSNNFGKFQHPEKFIPTIILNILEGKPVPIYGNGSNIRDWIYADDFVLGIWRTINEKSQFLVTNYGGRNQITNFLLVSMIAKQMSEYNPTFKFVEDRKGHDFRYDLGCGSPCNRPLHRTIETTIDWYKNNLDWVEYMRNKK